MTHHSQLRRVVFCLATLLATGGILLATWTAPDTGTAAPRPPATPAKPPLHTPVPVRGTPLPPQTPINIPRSRPGSDTILLEPQPTQPVSKSVTIPAQEVPVPDGFSSLATTPRNTYIVIGTQPQVGMNVTSASVSRFAGIVDVNVTFSNPSCNSIQFGNIYNPGGPPGTCVAASALYTSSTLFVVDPYGRRGTLSSPPTGFTLPQNSSQSVSLQFLIDPAMGYIRLVYAPTGLGQRIGVFALE